jgi:hypothetical protein
LKQSSCFIYKTIPYFLLRGYCPVEIIRNTVNGYLQSVLHHFFTHPFSVLIKIGFAILLHFRFLGIQSTDKGSNLFLWLSCAVSFGFFGVISILLLQRLRFFNFFHFVFVSLPVPNGIRITDCDLEFNQLFETFFL